MMVKTKVYTGEKIRAGYPAFDWQDCLLTRVKRAEVKSSKMATKHFMEQRNESNCKYMHAMSAEGRGEW